MKVTETTEAYWSPLLMVGPFIYRNRRIWAGVNCHKDFQITKAEIAEKHFRSQRRIRKHSSTSFLPSEVRITTCSPYRQLSTNPSQLYIREAYSDIVKEVEVTF
ncbi:predicted protein [Coccidioides posadasii str. Silveira]|uniref:Predicted protein n=1 Tax=Coccidioides posadasii (strain RMSCC 757 / Silveira) TaxID=443226 RepID=E9CTC3_COCPS|nr:predicted protein [Coccidioides posadasii str. Silveira]